MTAFAELDIRARTEQLDEAADKIRGVGDEGQKTEEKVKRSTSAMSAGFGKLAAAAAAAAASFSAGSFIASATREAEKFETAMFKVDAIIRATGGVAGKSSDQLREQARQIAFATLESTEGVLKAQQTLLTFRNVQGEIFDRTIKAAADMSAALGGDLNSATLQLAKALENPTEGLSALSRSGTVFTQAQKDLVKEMVKTGRTAEAQAFVLAELEAQYGGAAVAAAQGLAGAQDTLGQAFQELKLGIADSLGLVETATRLNQNLANVIIVVTENLDVFGAAFKVAGVALAGLAATQIPVMITSLAALTSGLSLAAIASGALSSAMGVLGAAVTLAGGPLGVAVGLLTAGAAYMVLFRDNANTVDSALNDVKNAQEALNKAMGVFNNDASPVAIQQATEAANAYRLQAQAARDAAKSELARINAMLAGQEAMGLDPEAALFLGGQQSGAVVNLREAEASLAEAEAMSQAALERLSASAGQAKQTVAGLNAEILGGTDKGGGAADAFADRLTRLQEQFMTEQELLNQWYEESQQVLADRRAQEILGEEEHRNLLLEVEQRYQEQLGILRAEANNQQLSAAGEFFGALASVAQAGGERMTRVARVFGAAQALINTYVAASQTLADPSLPFFAKLAAVAKVIAAGMSFVSAIKGGGGGGGSSGGSIGASRSPAAQPAQPQRVIRFDVQGDGMFADMLRQNVDAIADAIIDEQRLGGTTILVAQ